MTPDLAIRDSGLRTAGDRLCYLWVRIMNGETEAFRCVALRELTYIPIEAREDPDVLGKQWAAVRGLYNAGVDFVYTAAGIFTPVRVGVAQYYGAAAEGVSEETAAVEALRRMAAVEAVIANFPQARLADPLLTRVEWLLDFLVNRTKSNVLAILGHPDPRMARRGLGREGSLGDVDEDLASQQNEILFRGLAKLKEDFVFLVTAAHVGRRRLADGLVKVAEEAGNIASRRKGSINIGFSLSLPLLAAIAGTHAGGFSTTNSQAQGASDGVSQGWGRSHTDGQAHTDSQFESNTVGSSWGHSISQSDVQTKGHADSQGVATSQSASDTHGSSESSNWQRSHSASFSMGEQQTAGLSAVGQIHIGRNESLTERQGLSWGAQSGTFESHTDTTGVTQSQVSTDSVANSHGTSETWSDGGFAASTRGKGQADTVSQADGVQESAARSHADSLVRGAALGQSGVAGFAGGFSAGMIPGVSLGRSWQTEDDVADRLTEVLRGLESLLNQASAEGGFLTDAYLFTGSERGVKAGAALVPQAFHGPNVPTPVLTIPGGEATELMRTHALAFRPSNGRSERSGDPFAGLLWTDTATLLTAGQLAAYTAPGLFEESTAVTVQEKLPPLAFYPDMPGDVVLGHQYSPETGDLTDVPIRLTRERHFHTAFAGDTGYGKSVAAIRMAYETTLKWQLRTIALDFGTGWRALLNAPGLEDHVEIYQLWPGAVSPFRWNPLQVGRNIAPEIQWRAFCDIFGAISRLGVRRQVGEVRDALRQVYVAAGVLIDDPEVRGDAEWGTVRASEEADAETGAGTRLGALNSDARQRLAVRRSRRVGLTDLYSVIEDKFEATPPRDQMLRGVLEGILYRLHPLVQGAAAAQYAPGADTLALEDLARPWGLAVLEGGSFLDEFSKAFLLGWSAWHIYTDAVVRRIRRAAAPDEYLQIFFEEANKILSGIDYGQDDDGGGAAYTAEQFANMWRDSRKYGVWLHPITQSPALIPPGILSSCANLVVEQLKNPKDRDLVTAAIARSEKGFTDEEWRRFLARLPVARSVARFGYSPELAEQEPVLFRPLMLQVPEPTDEEIAAAMEVGRG
jgi:hypothetical protein